MKNYQEAGSPALENVLGKQFSSFAPCPPPGINDRKEKTRHLKRAGKVK
jgi:hypothetical protein